MEEWGAGVGVVWGGVVMLVSCDVGDEAEGGGDGVL